MSLFGIPMHHVEAVLRVLAYIAAGAWAYFHFLRGRTFKPLLDPSLSASLIPSCGRTARHVRLSVRNVGQSRIQIAQKGSGLRVLLRTPAAEGFIHHTTTDILTPGEWLEPSETVMDEFLVDVPAAVTAARCELHVVGTKSMWKTATIAIRHESEVTTRG